MRAPANPRRNVLRRPPGAEHAGPSPRAAGATFHVGRGSPGQSALPPPQWIAGSYPSFRPPGGLAPGVQSRPGDAVSSPLPHDRRIRSAGPVHPPGQSHPAAMAGEPLAQARRLDPAVDRLGRHHEDGRTRISAEMPELVQGGHGPVGDEHHLALAGLTGLAPLNEQPAGAVVPPFDGGPNESGASSATRVPRNAGAAITGTIGLKGADGGNPGKSVLRGSDVGPLKFRSRP